jgi:hypothetical protein
MTMTTYTPDAPVRSEAGGSLAAWLTVERVAYGGLILVALALRLIGLGRSPLGPHEAQHALEALNAARGLPFDLSVTDPALLSLQRLMFSLFAATESATRIWPALLGGLSALCFYAFRQRLGQPGALMAALLWAISPMAVFTSRLGYGDALIPSLALASAAALEMAWRSANSAQLRSPASEGSRTITRLYAVLGGAALGLMLAAGGNAYTVLAMAILPALVWRDAARLLWEAIAPSWRVAALALIAALVVSATFFFTNPEGTAAAATLPGRWLADLMPWVGEYSAFELAGRLVMSEIVVIVLGLIGLGLAARRRDPFGLAAGLAAGVALAPVLMGRGRHPVDLVLVVLPLVFLAGPVGARVFGNFRQWWSDLDSVLLAVVNGVLLVAAAFCLPGAFNPANTENWRQIYLIVGSLTLILAVLQWFAYGIWGDWRTVARVAPFVPLVLGLFWTLSQSIGIGLDHGAWRQANPLHESTSEGYLDLADELEGIAALHGRGNREISVDLVLVPGRDEPLEPVLRWLLRDYPMVRRSAAVPLQPAPIVITAAEVQPALADAYGGADFPVLVYWQPSMLDSAYARLRWVLFREARIPPEVTGAVIWVRRQSDPGSEGVGQAVPISPAVLDMPSEPPAESGEAP